MDVHAIFSFLVHPSKGKKVQPEIGGTSIPLKGRLSSVLTEHFQSSANECKVEIAFRPQDDGVQYNERRNEIIETLRHSDLDHAAAIAARLQSVTTNRSGLGLLFVIVGQNGPASRIYISRFPADSGIIAEERHNTLKVELIEKVFMKNALAYKSVVYEDQSLDTGFWTGRAVDRQINNNAVALSTYWIREFLQSDFRTTSANGTRRLALALKSAIDNADDLEIKQELSAVAVLAKSLNKKTISIDNFAERFALSQKAQQAIMPHLKSPAFRFDDFVFSAEEFRKHIRYQSVSINNGAMLTAPSGRFDEVFKQRRLEGKNGDVEFTTQGQVVDARLRTSSR